MKKGVKISLIVLAVILILAIGYVSYSRNSEQGEFCVSDDVCSVDQNNQNAQLANPASVYCVEHNGTLDIRTDETGGQYGVCVFDDGTECDEWKFFNGEC